MFLYFLFRMMGYFVFKLTCIHLYYIRLCSNLPGAYSVYRPFLFLIKASKCSKKWIN